MYLLYYVCIEPASYVFLALATVSGKVYHTRIYGVKASHRLAGAAAADQEEYPDKILLKIVVSFSNNRQLVFDPNLVFPALFTIHLPPISRRDMISYTCCLLIFFLFVFRILSLSELKRTTYEKFDNGDNSDHCFFWTLKPDQIYIF